MIFVYAAVNLFRKAGWSAVPVKTETPILLRKSLQNPQEALKNYSSL